MVWRWLIILGAVLVITSSTTARAAVIVTTNGEEIVCEIVRETDTYFVVDHRGYRRYVLKTQIRSLDRQAGEGYRLGPLPRRHVSVLGGYRVLGQGQTRGFGTARASLAFPVNEHLLLQADLNAGEGNLIADHGAGDPLAGPISWTGAMVGAQWQLQPWRVRPLIEIGVGYYFLSHTVDTAEVNWMKRAIIAAEATSDTSFSYSEPMDRALGVSLGAGAMLPVSPRLALTFRTSVLVLNTGFTRTWEYAPVPGQQSLLQSRHGLTLEMVHALLGIQWTF
jgi:hypothetical protein